VEKVFLQTADNLADLGIFSKPQVVSDEVVGNRRFVELGRLLQLPRPDYGVPTEIARAVRLTLWDYVLEGILAPTTKENDHRPGQSWFHFDTLRLTPHGVLSLLGSNQLIRVYDSDGYLQNFWSVNPAPDHGMMRYLSESVSVFRGGHLLGCVVLLGAASERLIDVLADVLRVAQGSPQGDTWFEGKYKRKAISDRFGQVCGVLGGQFGAQLKSADLEEPLQGVVKLTFEEIRLARNDIAHSQGRDFTQNEVAGLLHHFVPYFLYVNKIIGLLRP
jgi:hypothetical protein